MEPSKRIILDLCGGTGSWSKPYRDAGYNVTIVDPLVDPLCEGGFQGTTGEYVELLRLRGAGPVHGVLCAPPCDHFSLSGAQYWKAKDQDGRTRTATDIVRDCLEIINLVKPAWWALENHIGRIQKLVPELGDYKMQFDPCDFGDPYTKKTRLWGKFNVSLRPNRVTPIRSTAQGSWLQKLGGKSAKTKKLRSMTPQGFARAFFNANP